MSIVLFPAIILLHMHPISSSKVHGVDVYILFLETALVSMCISLKSYSMEINNLKKVLILPAVSGNMSMLYDIFVCIK